MDNELGTKWERLVGWLQDHKGFECHVEWKELPGGSEYWLISTSAVNVSIQVLVEVFSPLPLLRWVTLPLIYVNTDNMPQPGSTLLTIPASALLNPLTLASSIIPTHLFPRCTSYAHRAKRARTSSTTWRLNTTQLLTLYLALTRHLERRHASPWEAYLDSLPGDFRPWHPLTWLVPPSDAGQVEKWKRWNALAGMVPRSARMKLEAVRARFDEDLEVVQRVLVRLISSTPSESDQHQREEEPFKSQHLAATLSTEDILWAWLNGQSSFPLRIVAALIRPSQHTHRIHPAQPSLPYRPAQPHPRPHPRLCQPFLCPRGDHPKTPSGPYEQYHREARASRPRQNWVLAHRPRQRDEEG